MERDYLHLKNLRNKDDAVVGVVIAVLLVGLILSIIVLIQTVFVPSWMEQIEAEHMDDVANQFALLKFAIDTQSVTEKNIPITTSITLGNKELPFFTSSRSFGFLRILDEEYSLNITNGTFTIEYFPEIIKYSSSNTYFLNIDYIYEAGAVITSQDEGNVMFIKPNFLVNYDIVLDEVNISFTLSNIIGIGGKKSVSGFGTYPIQTNFSKSNRTLITDVQNMVITTSYPDSWRVFINSTLKNVGLIYGAANDFWITSTNDKITVNFNSPPVSPKIDIFLDAIDIFAQVAPGWIE
ncbi:MAG: hypothetical protein JSW06_03370 [Thermoplasmatales archaeon]|nr:MAG: hypothetical protein JSW06_03370 [Thermoplasmatales archaeon]